MDVAGSAVLTETLDGQTYHYLNGLAPIAEFDGANTLYNLYDGAGTVRQLTNPSGVVQRTQTFDPYGNPYSETGTDPSMFGFGGGIRDANGLVYWKGRYYSPWLGLSLQVFAAKTLPSWSTRWDQAQWINRSTHTSLPQKALATTYIGLSVAAVPLTALAIIANTPAYGTSMLAFGAINGAIAAGRIGVAYRWGSPEERAWARTHGAEAILQSVTWGALSGPIVHGAWVSGPVGRIAVSSIGVYAGGEGIRSTVQAYNQRGYWTAVDTYDTVVSGTTLGLSVAGLATSSYALQYGNLAGRPTSFVDLMSAKEAARYRQYWSQVAGRRPVGGRSGHSGALFPTSDVVPFPEMARQEQQMSCVAACIRYMLQRQGVKVSEAQIRKIVHTSSKGTWTIKPEYLREINELPNVKIRYGTGLQVSSEGQALAVVQNLRNPWMASLDWHAVVVENVDRTTLLISDPLPGKGQWGTGPAARYTVSWGNFFYNWKNGQYQGLFPVE